MATIAFECTKPACHGQRIDVGDLNVSTVALAVDQANSDHRAACPTPEPQPLADLRRRLYDLEECDDPDYQDWCDRIDREVMPLITVAAQLIAPSRAGA